jgi:ectoine hydroxylase-related dioxygenase (phytanoyl-CoA dioxygenase family)
METIMDSDTLAPARLLGAADQEVFKRDGAVRLCGATSAAWVDQLRRGMERNIREPGPFFRRLSEPGQPGDFLIDMWSRERIPEFQAYIETSGVAEIAATALGEPQARLLQDTWFAKRAGTIERTPWHHDTVIFGPFLSIWVALDPIPKAASLEFIRGSHLWNRYFMPQSYFASESGAAMLRETERYYLDYHRSAPATGTETGTETGRGVSRFEPIPDIEAERSQYDIISWDMEAGDCIVFDALTLHGAPGNPMAQDARRFVTRWVGSNAVLAPHGENTIGVLRQQGFEVPFGVGEPVHGRLFPLLPSPA